MPPCGVRVPPVDQPLDDAEWRRFVAREGFGQLVAVGTARDVAVVAPLPFVLDGDVVHAHAPRRNPIFEALAERDRAVLCVVGDVAFIPSAWKAIDEEDPRLGIPTTYFAAVQLTGRTELVDDPDELAAVLRRQLHAFQPGLDVADPAEAHRARFAEIRGIVLHVESVDARFKFGGNVDEAHRRAVLGSLEERGSVGDLAAAANLRRRIGTSQPSAFRR